MRGYGGRWGYGAVVVVMAVLAVGCSGGGDGADGKDRGRSAAQAGERGDAGAEPAPEASAFVPRADRLPRDRAGAERLARSITLQPRSFGADFARGVPYEDDSSQWGVLGTDCTWQRGTLPGSVFTSVARHYAQPAAGGKGPVEATTVVSVHRDAYSADREMATSLEEVLRCPTQQLNADDVLSDLRSDASARGNNRQETVDDHLFERGSYRSRTTGGPYPYEWATSRLGPVTITVTVRGSKGHSAAGVGAIRARAFADLQWRTKKALQ
ncbi:hypothetical protein AAHZ94_25905 [Streptomyces sp. HSW2009]|uniref:hypothetical protein n=1 Tax=Streptomyces sp. HSW2009 TaxID=3142890 RepID=UPI0032EBCE8F